MAAKYRKVDPRFWTDEKVRQLDIHGRLLALWMLTSTRTNRVGIVQWSPGLASEETGILLGKTDTLCHTVCDTLSWTFDTDAKLVYMTHWWRYNSPDNPKALDGALSDLHDLPAHHLWDAISQAGDELNAALRPQYASKLDTLCHTLCHTVSHRVSPQEQEQEQEQEQDNISPPPKSPAAEKARDDIDAIYRLYPRKVGKRDALKAIAAALKRLAPGGHEVRYEVRIEWLRDAVFTYAASPAGQPPPKGGNDYRPHPATWFNAGRYDDDRSEWEKPNGIDSKPAEDHPGRIRAPAGKYDRFDAPG